ncbi:uncharacterized protein LOC141613524 [Silene latifolia]|uniref:uncharacterized protein LOC141613524 n=1 Tax=Silene latifolia TaxID=37657 RepID=UPI003D76B551
MSSKNDIIIFSSQEFDSDLEQILEQEEDEIEEPELERSEVIPPSTPMVQITQDDVAGEISFWSTSVYCYVLGANPPSSVLTGFVKRDWQGQGVDKISFMPNGVFLVRFKSKEQQQFVLNNGHLLFDNKPVIVNEWRPEIELIKHEVKIVPIWMKIHGLDVKFWGQESLKKISGVVGKFVKSDDATTHKNFLGFARILVEVEIGQQFPSEIKFLDEHGKTHTVKVVYDWLPVSCTGCKGMGHVAKDCRKGTGKMKVSKVRPATKVPEKSVVPVVTVTPVAPRVMMTPVIVQKTPIVESSIPRRFITKLMRNDKGEKRSFPPGSVTVMEALTASLQRSRLGISGLVERGETSKSKDNGNTICQDWAICTNTSLHKGGRIWLIWDTKVYEVTVYDVTIQCIHSKVVDKARKTVFWFTVVYGLNQLNERDDLWNSLRSYHGRVNGPWLVGGDFNSVMASDERIGSAPVTNAETRPMLQTMQDCNLVDLSAQGAFYTWSNKHEKETRVYSRIDRV